MRINLLLLLCFNCGVFILCDTPCKTAKDCYKESVALLKADREKKQAHLEEYDSMYRAMAQRNSEVEAKLNEITIPNFFNKIYPIGSVFISFSNQAPPFQGQGSVQWDLIPEGLAVMTGNDSNSGTISGSTRIDNGRVNDHALTIDQMPSHQHTESHGVEYPTTPPVGKTQWRNVSDRSGGKIPITSNTGGNQAHSHNINGLNQKLLFWKRVY